MATKQVKRTSGGVGTAETKAAPAVARAKAEKSRRPADSVGKSKADKRLAPKVEPFVWRGPVIDEKHDAAVRKFEAALELEQRGQYGRARDIFQKLVLTAPLDVVYRAQAHVSTCVEKVRASSHPPKDAGELAVEGVAELNARHLDRAVDLLGKALKLEPRREEVRYALAAAYALKGEPDPALEHLKAAIKLRPENRFQARHDADFSALTGDPRFAELVK